MHGGDKIPTGVFSGCKKLATIILPKDLSMIGSDAFGGTTWYESQPEGLVYIGNVLYAYKGDMPANSTIVIREGTIGISGSAFNGCSGLVSVSIPQSVVDLGAIIDSGEGSVGGSFKGVFDGCKNLSSITIPNGVKTIGYAAFRDCKGLTSITIPSSIISIDYKAFVGCTKLTSVTSFIQDPFDLEYFTFSDETFSKATLTVPKGTKKAYESKRGWKDFQTIVENSN
jgi:hypothetical protein